MFAEGLTPLAVDVDEYGAARAIRFARAPARTAKWHEPAEVGCRRARCSSPPARSRTPCSRARTRSTSRSTASTSAPATTTAIRSSPRMRWRSRRSADVLMTRSADGRFVSYFGDLHPVVLRQRREGARLDQAGLSGGLARARAARAGERVTTTRRSSHGSTTSCAPPCTRSTRLTPTIVELIVKAPAAARAFRPGQFYRLQNFAALAAGRRRHADADGRPGADRRLGRSRARPRLDDRARDGRIVQPVRDARVPASRWC